MSRKAQRLQVSLTVTLTVDGDPESYPAVTQNISSAGCLLRLSRELPIGRIVHVALLDDEIGNLIDMDGVVARQLHIAEGIWATGVHFPDPGLTWADLCRRKGAITKTGLMQVARRYRILVVGDEARIRGALALYVTSGFDVRFAGGVEHAREALASVHLDAVIAERELSDPAWVEILEASLERQPAARRLVRSSRGAVAWSQQAVERLVHRVVEIEDGVEALIDAITAARL